MGKLPGVYKANKKDGSVYYRSSLTYKGKHISLGSYDTEEAASKAYREGVTILENQDITMLSIIDNILGYSLDFDKCVSLINYRDNDMYIANPIYISRKFFYYYLSHEIVLKFDAQDLFYFSSHKIMKRGNHLFVNEYGNQVNINSRYGIRPHSVLNKDYRFKNGDKYDYRMANIEVINTYYGVSKCIDRRKNKYKAVVHITGNFTVGHYDTPVEAAIAYNRAVDYLKEKGCPKSFDYNNVTEIGKREYKNIYKNIKLPDKITSLYFD